jgi:hypothetical protein
MSELMRNFVSLNMPTCIYCGVYQESRANLKRHTKLSPRCHQAFIKQISLFNTNAVNADSSESDAASESDPRDEAKQSMNWPHDQDITVDEALGEHSCQPYVEDVIDEDVSDGPGMRCWNQGIDDMRFIESYPDPAGVPIDTRRGTTKFEKILKSKGDKGPWGKFKTKGKWELAKWLLQNVGHNQILKFLELPIMHHLPHSSVQYINKCRLD